MKTNGMYEAPQLEIAEIKTEQGFVASASTIENPTTENEDAGFWS